MASKAPSPGAPCLTKEARRHGRAPSWIVSQSLSSSKPSVDPCALARICASCMPVGAPWHAHTESERKATQSFVTKGRRRTTCTQGEARKQELRSHLCRLEVSRLTRIERTLIVKPSWAAIIFAFKSGSGHGPWEWELGCGSGKTKLCSQLEVEHYLRKKKSFRAPSFVAATGRRRA